MTDEMNHDKLDMPEGDMVAPEDLIGNDLADQIQDLLDDAKETEASAGVAPPEKNEQAVNESDEMLDEQVQQDISKGESGEHESVESDDEGVDESMFCSPEELVQQETESEAAEPVVAQAEQTPQTTESTEQADQDQAISMIDDYLAENADQAIAGDFETVQEVLASNVAAVDTSEIAVSFEAPEAVVAKEANVDDMVAGDFESIDEVAEQPSPPVEKTEQPKPEPVVVETVSEESIAHADRVTVCKGVLRQFCAIVNRPLIKAGPEVQSAIGLAAMVTVFNASMLLIGKLAFAVLG